MGGRCQPKEPESGACICRLWLRWKLLCEQRKVGCGGTMAATTTWKTRTVTLGDATVTKIRDTYTMCNDWITAPTGKTIQIRVTALKRCQM
ncbi:hypothetical protein COOONC_17428 [Cooperia oncophora]